MVSPSGFSQIFLVGYIHLLVFVDAKGDTMIVYQKHSGRFRSSFHLQRIQFGQSVRCIYRDANAFFKVVVETGK